MIEFVPESIYYTREAVEDKFKQGKLKRMETDLLDFANRHKSEILECAFEDEENPSDETLLDNLRAETLSRGALNPAAALADVYSEISKEVWYKNENLPTPANEVTEEWRENYSKMWREARTFEAFFLIEKHADELIKILRS